MKTVDTEKLKEAILIFDVKVLEHFIIEGNTSVSFAAQDIL